MAPTDPARIVRRANDAIVALDQLVAVDRALALRAALAVTRSALEQQAPRPRAFVTVEHEREWTDADIECVAEALACVAELAAAVGDEAATAALVDRGPALAARLEAYRAAVSDAADAWDYDAGAVVVGVVSALVEAALVGSLALGQVAWRAAWLVPCAAEADLPSSPPITKGPAVWEERRRRRAIALREVVAAAIAPVQPSTT